MSAVLGTLLVIFATFSAAAAGWNFWSAFTPTNALARLNFVCGCVAAVCVAINLLNLWALWIL